MDKRNRRINCFLIGLLWKLVPLTSFRCWLLAIHLEACPHCQQELASRENIEAIVEDLSNVKLPTALITRASRQADVAEDRIPPVPSGRISIILTRIYAVVMTVAIFVLLLGFGWYFSQPGPESVAFSPGASDRVSSYSASNYSALSLNYVRAKGQPADSLMIYRTSEPEMIIIWVQSQN
ncbi:MAG TPA: hypothetical protein PLP94_01750 [Candidatus Saccharicenans sp.]|nr:hypothetical protein [Candidatus Saccharicenans sp.]HOL45196.1 hypothetical protein [Candidatus Saccharicenans sp.]HOM94142.1 hypothetical protein [Candidatus Saccharicenans sp.]HPP23460.1 hypothetical protein [Candidatus Saccharicenans sp.]HRT25947.1 hypothetical protein [Candidatus Saccharicenans sp.]